MPQRFRATAPLGRALPQPAYAPDTTNTSDTTGASPNTANTANTSTTSNTSPNTPLDPVPAGGEIVITDDLDLLLAALPPRIRALLQNRQLPYLLEIVLDLGRLPEARYSGQTIDLGSEPVTSADLDYVVERVGQFGDDNRAGIGGTLHRISAIRNRRGQVVGLTCRVGRAVRGTVALIRDVIDQGRSILILGRPGVGKTTLLREAARVLADELGKRVVVVDTSNEIAGDGDIPHPGIGRARRMQVARTAAQHAVMIEAVENHMPEVIIIDEIGTAEEAAAARTIAERGVQLVGTAHGRTLENLLVNPTLSDLVGGIQAVTLGDEEARRRGTQKTVLERKAPPTFDVLIEQESRHMVGMHQDVAEAVDELLRGESPRRQMRERMPDGNIRSWFEATPPMERSDGFGLPARGAGDFGPGRDDGHFGRDGREGREGRRARGSGITGQAPRQAWWEERRNERSDRGGARAATGPNAQPPRGTRPDGAGTMRWLDPELALSASLLENEGGDHPAEGETAIFRKRRIYPLGVSRGRLEQAILELGLPAVVSREESEADAVFALKSMSRKQPDRIEAAQAAGKPVYLLRSAGTERLREALADLFHADLGRQARYADEVTPEDDEEE